MGGPFSAEINLNVVARSPMALFRITCHLFKLCAVLFLPKTLSYPSCSR